MQRLCSEQLICLENCKWLGEPQTAQEMVIGGQAGEEIKDPKIS